MQTAAAAAIVALVLGLTAGSDAARTPEARAILAVAAPTPLAIEGRGFGVGEVVRLVARAGGIQSARTAIASAKGRFRIGFDLRVDRCADLTVRATGSQGSRAVLYRPGACKRP